MMEKKPDQVNYIKHHLRALERLTNTKGFRPNHISVYEALFFLWNKFHFSEEFYVSRHEIMERSGIGSKDTYTKVIKELHVFGLIIYIPSFDPLRGSRIKMIRFDLTHPNTRNGTGNGTKNGNGKATEIAQGKDVGPKYKQYQTEENNQEREEKEENNFFDDLLE